MFFFWSFIRGKKGKEKYSNYGFIRHIVELKNNIEDFTVDRRKITINLVYFGTIEFDGEIGFYFLK